MQTRQRQNGMEKEELKEVENQHLKRRIAELEARVAELEVGEKIGERERQRAEDAIAERDRALQLYSALLAQEQVVQQRLSLLAEASEALVVSLDYEQALTRLAQLMVPQLADWCLIDLI